MEVALCLPEVLVSVLFYLPLKERMSCSLVAGRWREAAAVATTSITLRSDSSDKHAKLHTWLARHGQHLTRLDMSHKASCNANSFHTHDKWPGYPTLDLPWEAVLACTQLRELRLECFILWPEARSELFWDRESHTAASGSRDLAALTNLTSVTLSECLVTQPLWQPWPRMTAELLASALKALPHLQRLSLEGLKGVADLRYMDRSLQLPDDMLCSLAHAQLTHLQLTFDNVHDTSCGTLQHLTHMTSLQELLLGTSFNGSNPFKLYFGTPCGGGPPPLPTSLAALTGLARLSIRCAYELEPSVLMGLTLLTRLDVVDTRISSTAAVADLLEWLPRLQCLRHLCLHNSLTEYAASVEAYSALTANSLLQYLDLTDSALPMGVWQQVFPHNPGHLEAPRLPNLRAALLKPSNRSYVSLWGVGETPQHPACAMSSDDLEGLVQCCPVLGQLCVACANQYGDGSSVSLMPLVPLQHLRVLTIDGATSATMAHLVHLTNLGMLQLERSSIDIEHCRQLSALVRLEELRVPLEGHGMLDLFSQVGAARA